jgi:transcriptional regulatory protein GAL4
MLVQGLAIMALYLQKRNKPNAGYLCLGLAIRMAKALGMHTPIPKTTRGGLTVLESEMRIRIWWGLVTLEAGQSMTYGRPHSISLPSLSAVALPTNTDDALLTVSTTKLPPDSSRVTLYTALITQAKLAQMALASLDRVSRSLPTPTVEQIKWCGDFFRDQVAALPAYMQPGAPGPFVFARAVQDWRARDFRSVLYRPVLLSAAWNTTRKEANETVQEIVQ